MKLPRLVAELWPVAEPRGRMVWATAAAEPGAPPEARVLLAEDDLGGRGVYVELRSMDRLGGVRWEPAPRAEHVPWLALDALAVDRVKREDEVAIAGDAWTPAIRALAEGSIVALQALRVAARALPDRGAHDLAHALVADGLAALTRGLEDAPPSLASTSVYAYCSTCRGAVAGYSQAAIREPLLGERCESCGARDPDEDGARLAERAQEGGRS